MLVGIVDRCKVPIGAERYLLGTVVETASKSILGL